jgi:5-methyltetrahydropteroyltriglutamate--homocysteine methyltransferase
MAFAGLLNQEAHAQEKIIACTNCGMVPMRQDIAFAKLSALSRGAELARQRLG